MADTEAPETEEKLPIPDETDEQVETDTTEEELGSSGAESSDEPEESEGEDTPDEEMPEEDQGPSRLERFKKWYLGHKKVTIPATVLIALAIVFGLPTSRYTVLGLVLKKNYVIAVTDGKSNVPVSEVELSFRGKTAKTDADGKATLKGVPVGPGELKATKKYYSDSVSRVTMPIKSATDITIKLQPTGRQVPVHAVNKITGKPLAGATLDVAGAQAKTDDQGDATIVLPVDKDKLEGTISANGYNQQKVTVTVSHLATKQNTFQLVPAGKLYFLSKRTGKINVMKSDLDGSNSVVVLAATGLESEDDTILLASRDWQYLALKSRREGINAKLYLIDTKTDTLSEIDGGDATITLVGWSGHRVIYQLNRTKVQLWQPKRYALKTYDADKKQLSVIEETSGEGVNDNDYAASEIQKPTILADRVLYNIIWFSGYYSSARLEGKKHAVVSVKADGSGKQTLKDFDAKQTSYIDSVQSEVGEVYYRVYTANVGSFYTFKDGKFFADDKMNDEKFSKPYPTFLISPSSESTFWYEQRDGKNTLFVGNAGGEDGKEIAALSEYSPYGWYSDNYVLVSKSSSELYVLPSNGVGSTGQILKITDYHKPATIFYGYGYGYGGL